MKKILACVLTAAMTMSLLTACGGSGSGDSGNAGNSGNAGSSNAGGGDGGGHLTLAVEAKAVTVDTRPHTATSSLTM